VTYDAIVIGLGGAGSATAMHLAKRGRRVLGLEQFTRAHDMGSSHGRSRVIRKAYFEDPRYVPLLVEAYRGWRSLETQSATSLLSITGGLNLGPPEHPCIRGVEESARQHGLHYERLQADALLERWPMLRLESHEVGIYEGDAGILNPEKAVRAFQRAGEDAGAELLFETAVEAIETHASGVLVHAGGKSLSARALILTTGAWSAGPNPLVPSPVPLTVERQVQLWFRASPIEDHRSDRLALLIRFFDDRSYYSLPDTGHGVKACRHHGGAQTSAEHLIREVNPADIEDVRWFLERTIPGANMDPHDARVCMYTNTPDDHFMIGAHPNHPRTWLATGFSGHGFKFMPVIGEALSQLVLDGHTNHGIELFHPVHRGHTKP